MAYQKFTGTYHSSNHSDKIHYYIYEPETDLRAILQIVHDFGDRVERNEKMIRYFTDHGVMICGSDHIGHGRSSAKEDYGYFGHTEGWRTLVKDTKKLTHYMKKEYPHIPYFLYGHGMGSLIVRLDLLHETGITGVILSGTSGKQKYCRRRLVLSAVLKRIKGARHISRCLERSLYKKLNRKFLSEHDDWSWVAADETERKCYMEKHDGKLPLSVAAYEDILKMLALVSTKKWYTMVDKDLSFLLLSGKEDPIGNFGKGVEEVRRGLEDTCHRVTIKMYDKMRHNIQDEQGCGEVFGDILQWMKFYIKD